MKRWIDLSGHGMRLRLAVLPRSRVLVLEGGDGDEAAARTLGFSRRPSGSWVRTTNVDVNPREFMRILPRAVVREMADDEFILRVDAPASPREPADERVSSPTGETSQRPIGLNRFSHAVYETNGIRRFVDQRGRITFENETSSPMPGVFLRAADATALAHCAEGFIRQCLAPDDVGSPVPEHFVRLIRSELGDISVDRLAAAVEVVAGKLIMGKGSASLRDRFGTALSLERALRPILGHRIPDYPLSVALRRVMGADHELIGKAVLLSGPGSSVISALLPRGVREATAVADADIVVDLDGGSTEEILDRLGGRSSAALTVLVRPVEPQRDDIGRLGDDYHLDAVARLSNRAGGPVSVALVGIRIESELERGETERPIREIDAYADLWTWAADVAMTRTRIVEGVRSGLATEADLVADPSILKNEYQIPYASASRTGVPSTMVPKDLDGAHRGALDRLVAAVGDVDEKVAIDFGVPIDRLADIWVPEQIDAIAMAVHAEERGRSAFLIADGAGVGKGRECAGLLRRAVLQGRKVLYLSEREMNLGDFHRDVVHIGSGEILPYVLNEGAVLIDETTGEPFPIGDRDVLRHAVVDGAWPDGVQVVYATYSQFNRAADASARSRWLRSAVDEDVVLILDECHNAAGDSITSENVSIAVENAGFVVYSSATFSASPEMMGFYGPLFPQGIEREEIASMMRKGGDEFAEVVSSMLVSDGVMVRREQDLSHIEFVQVVDADRIARNRDLMDRLAAVIARMAELSGDLDAWMEDRNRRNEAVGKGLRIGRIGFGSPLYTLTRLFSASLLAEFAAERAIAALEAGEKPVILVENTIQAILDESAVDGRVPDFRSVVHRILDQMTNVREVGAAGDERLLAAPDENAGIGGSVAAIRVMIDALPTIPASAIDEVRSRIEAAGYSCGEITGRTLEIREGRVVPRRSRNRTRTKNDFNAGELDSVIINVTGSTGVDFHSSERFKDKRRRVMIELQGPSHVLRQIQAYYRVCRRNQTSTPRIEMLSSGLPVEMRLAAMRNQRLRRLSANVSSNRDSAFLTRNIPDLLNRVGDTVISRYAEMRPDLLERLHLTRGEAIDATPLPYDEAPAPTTEGDGTVVHSANAFLARLMLLPTESQERILSELVHEYRAHIAELEAKDENPLRARELDGIVHVRSVRIFEGGSKFGESTVFNAPLNLMEVMIERVAEPIHADQVVEAVERGTASFARVNAAVGNLRRNRDAYLSSFLPKRARTVDEALAQGAVGVVNMAARIEALTTVLPMMVPGRRIPYAYAGDGAMAVITDVRVPPPGLEHLASRYEVDLVRPGATRFDSLRLETVLAMPGVLELVDGKPSVMVVPGLDGNDYDRILEEFEGATATRMTPGRILTSNIFRAVRLAAEHRLGSLVSFVDADGVRHRGVHVRRNFERHLDKVDLRVEGVEAALSLLAERGAELSSLPGAPSRSLVITPTGAQTFSVRLPPPPKRRGSPAWPSEAYEELHGSGAVDDRGRSRVPVTGTEPLRCILNVLADVGIVAFYASPKLRREMDTMIQEPDPEIPRMVA